MFNTRWTYAEENKLTRLRKHTGLTWNQIAHELNTSTRTHGRLSYPGGPRTGAGCRRKYFRLTHEGR